MSIGEDRVRVKFNPSADGIVDQLKQKSAELIDICETLKSQDGRSLDARSTSICEGERLASLAQTAYEEAAMWAVKAATGSK